MTHIDDMTTVIDNDEGAYTIVKEIVMEVGDHGPSEIGARIKEFVSEGSANRLADMMLEEFMQSVPNRELGMYYIIEFDEDLQEDDEEDEDG